MTPLFRSSRTHSLAHSKKSTQNNNATLHNLDTFVWYHPDVKGQAPLPRAFHSAVLYAGSVYIFGGCDATQSFNNLYKIDTGK